MIVCMCHAVRESTVVEAARAGLTATEISQHTRAGTSCGCCRETVATLVAEAHRCQGGGEGCSGCPRQRHHAPHPGTIERSAA